MTETSSDDLVELLLDQAFNELHWSEFLDNFRRCAADLAKQKNRGH